MASVLLTNLSIFNLVFCTTCSPSTTGVLSTLWISPTLWNTQTNNPFIELSAVNNPIDHSTSPLADHHTSSMAMVQKTSISHLPISNMVLQGP
ncbi:hypothetical protein AMECASPLE_023361 [Ameca splendens]|uniref:Secreted protein n=1 Tax=Ameca splendens TaxID=208324 RepID=A0ABV1AB96_9TELE